MKTLLIVAAVSALAAPAWAVNKCIGPDGKVSFQDAPCAGKGEQLNVRPASGAAQLPSAPASGTKPATEAQRIENLVAESQAARRRRDLETRLLPEATAAIAANHVSCQQQQKDLAASQYAYRQNLYGKTHAAQMASEMAAVGSRCDMKDRELRAELDALVSECSALGCKR